MWDCPDRKIMAEQGLESTVMEGVLYCYTGSSREGDQRRLVDRLCDHNITGQSDERRHAEGASLRSCNHAYNVGCHRVHNSRGMARAA